MSDDFDRVTRDLARMNGSAIVGALDETTAQKLAWSEFGTHTAPARPTLSVTTDRLVGAIDRKIQRELAAVLDGRGGGVIGQEVLAEVARDLAEETRNAIDGNTPPALAASTLAKRRARGNTSTRTLVDTGEMRSGIGVQTSADPNAFSGRQRDDRGRFK